MFSLGRQTGSWFLLSGAPGLAQCLRGLPGARVLVVRSCRVRCCCPNRPLRSAHSTRAYSSGCLVCWSFQLQLASCLGPSSLRTRWSARRLFTLVLGLLGLGYHLVTAVSDPFSGWSRRFGFRFRPWVGTCDPDARDGAGTTVVASSALRGATAVRWCW